MKTIYRSMLAGISLFVIGVAFLKGPLQTSTDQKVTECRLALYQELNTVDGFVAFLEGALNYSESKNVDLMSLSDAEILDYVDMLIDECVEPKLTTLEKYRYKLVKLTRKKPSNNK